MVNCLRKRFLWPDNRSGGSVACILNRIFTHRSYNCAESNMQGNKGANRHWPWLVIEFERDISNEPKTKRKNK